MHSPYEWSTICKTCVLRYKLDEEWYFVVQRIGVDIDDKDKMMAKTEIECCPLCFVAIAAELERMSDK